MPIVRRTRADIDQAKLLAELAAPPRPTVEESTRRRPRMGMRGPTRGWPMRNRYFRLHRRTRFVPSGRGWG
jgi:hypothetical protein